MHKENKKYYLKDEVVYSIINNDAIPIGIYVDDINNAKKIIDICNGILIPGGDEINYSDLKLIKYIYDKDIPCLGICLGMQEMGYLFNGEMGKIGNYNHLKPELKYVHNIKINKSSKLYEIINDENIIVNSRHKDYLIKTDLDISSISDVIESIEDKNKKFFIGVQWHPESMLSYDINSNLLFKEFIKQAKLNNK